MKRLTLPFLLLYIMCCGNAFAQSKGDCIQKIRDDIKKISTIPYPGAKQVYYFAYTTIIEYWDKVTQPSVHLPCRIYMNKDQLHYVTKEAEIYQDNINAFMVIPSKKIILCSDAPSSHDKEKRLLQLLQFQDTLLSKGQLSHCETKMENGRNILKATLILNESIQKSFKAKNIIYWYDLDKERIVKSTIEYTTAHEVKSKTTIFNNMDLSASFKMQRPAAEKIMTAKNHLLPKYKGYHLIDNRNSNKP